MKKFYLSVVMIILSLNSYIKSLPNFYPVAKNLSIEQLQDAMRDLGADITKEVNSVNEDGKTGLYTAVESGDVETAKKLIKLGADTNIVDKMGQTPLHKAAALAMFELVKLLINNGAKLNAQQEDGYTPLMYSALTARVVIDREVVDETKKIIEYLLLHGADKNMTNSNGQKAADITSNEEIKDSINDFMPIATR